MKSNPGDIKLQKSVTGELIAFDTRKKTIIASGFEDEEDFEKWKSIYLALGSRSDGRE